MEKLRQWAPPPALGKPPDAVNEAATVMLWGITTEMVRAVARGSGRQRQWRRE